MTLVDPRTLDLGSLAHFSPIPVTLLPDKVVPINEVGEPLEPAGVTTQPVYFEDGWGGALRLLYVRRSINDRLRAAERTLPEGFALTLLDGWRSTELQLALHDHYAERGTPAGYVSDPKSDPYVAPHTTGGAVDITLSWKGTSLAIGTDFDVFNNTAWSTALENDLGAEPNRSLRRLLTSVLVAQGFVPYPMEWWHFSHGDQIWAFNHGLSSALYGPTHPPP